MFNGQPQAFWNNGPTPGQFYNFSGGYNAGITARPNEFTAPGVYGTQHSSKSITTGSSVVGVKFEGGVMIAADTLVSYGSMARFRDIDRVFKINEKTIIGVGGEYADFQSLKRTLDQKMIEDQCHGDNIIMKPKALYNWITRVLYNRRCRVNPLLLDMIVGGVEEDGTPFLGHVDARGRAYEDDIVATAFGKHLALPLLREQKVEGKLYTAAEASALLRKSMEVLYYRDTRTISTYTVGVCTKDNCVVEGPYNVNENWQLATMVKGY